MQGKVQKPQKAFLYSFNWKLARRSIQLIALALFIVLFIGSRRGVWNGLLINIPIRLDPLAIFANAIAHRAWLATSSLALVLILFTIIFGRAWCGWLCPLGTFIDLTPLKAPSKRQIPPETWRSVKYTILLAIFFAAIFTNLTLLIFDPLTIVFRTLSVSVWPALDQIVRIVEVTLYKLPPLQDSLTNLDQIIRPTLFPTEPAYYRDALLFAAIFVAILLLNRFGQRFWCRYICPLGALLGLFSKIAIFRRQVNDSCKQCGLCHTKCPTATIRPEKGFRSDPSECIMCMKCVEDCPRQSTSFSPAFSFSEWNHYDPQRRQFLTTAALTVTALAIGQSEANQHIDHPYLIQPPGSRQNGILSKCIRCGECSRACPTNAIQPAISEAGILGLWSPILIMKIGYCDYSCNACGKVCPVQAIPLLSLEEKRLQVIGKAAIDKNRCIAWGERRQCIICEEMCPVPDKAIILVEPPLGSNLPDEPGLRLPQVIADKCIGCGICETKCPVNSDAAIRVYSIPSQPKTTLSRQG